ncbi:MAG: GNAT family N-acetyltransferase [Chitinophagales bacterium]|nr:GNAT family N-acetyltransferase [Chitinophagales bacterium]
MTDMPTYKIKLLDEAYYHNVLDLYDSLLLNQTYILEDNSTRRNFLELISGINYTTWVILEEHAENFAGIILLHHVNSVDKSAEIGILLSIDFQGKSIFNKVFPLVKAYAKSIHEITTLLAVIHEQNVYAHKTAISNGFILCTKNAKMDEFDRHNRYIYALKI